MNENIFNQRLERKRLPTEEIEILEKINTDYCPGYNKDRKVIESICQDIHRDGEIGGYRL